MSLKVGDYAQLQMELSRAPLWAGADSSTWWKAKYQGHDVPVLLSVVCERHGDKTWTIPVELHPSGYELDAGSG